MLLNQPQNQYRHARSINLQNLTHTTLAAGRRKGATRFLGNARSWRLDGYVDFDAQNLRVAKQLYEARRRRDAAASIKGLFGEPSWDILLDLFIARKIGIALQVSSVCAGAGLPSTTILRWIARLEREGLIVRTADQDDARRRFVSLTSKGLKLTTALLDAVGPLNE